MLLETGPHTTSEGAARSRWQRRVRGGSRLGARVSDRHRVAVVPGLAGVWLVGRTHYTHHTHKRDGGRDCPLQYGDRADRNGGGGWAQWRMGCTGLGASWPLNAIASPAGTVWVFTVHCEKRRRAVLLSVLLCRGVSDLKRGRVTLHCGPGWRWRVVVVGMFEPRQRAHTCCLLAPGAGRAGLYWPGRGSGGAGVSLSGQCFWAITPMTRTREDLGPQVPNGGRGGRGDESPQHYTQSGAS